MWPILVFGVFAGLSAYVGIYLARATWLSDRHRTWITYISIGIILFVIYDLLSDSTNLVSDSASGGGYVSIGLPLLLLSGVGAGFAILLGLEKLAARSRPSPIPSAPIDPTRPNSPGKPLVGALPLPFLVAIGMGVHGLFEGFAVGAAFATGILSVALVLAVGIFLHKSAEGYCVCGCALTATSTYSSAQLAGLGLMIGAPLFLGILAGNTLASIPEISLLSYGVAVGVMGYVVIRLTLFSARSTDMAAILVGCATGFAIGFATSVLVALGGA